jgi:NAD(P)-dependent dehydrogenase (short-subunit alcohol dehydrogenase family)
MRHAVLITGAGSGIGLATACDLAGLGYDVFGTCLTEEELGQAKAETDQGIHWLLLDITNPDSIKNAQETIAEKVADQGLYGLVNNAGADIPGPLEFLPLDAFRKQLELNITGHLAMTQAFLPLIRKARGRIVFTGSIDGRAVTPFQGAYGVSKHGIEAMADILRMELSDWGIWVSVVQPGDIATPIWTKSLGLAEQMLQQLPEKAHVLYGPTMSAALSTARKMSQRAAPPQTVSKAIIRALTASKPRARYMVGWDARFRLALEILPARWLDRIIMGFIRKG